MKQRHLSAPGQPLPRRLATRSLAGLLSLALLAAPIAQAQSPNAKFRGDPPVTLNFVNADIEGVTRAMAAILKQQFVVDPRVKGSITLYSEEPLAPREAYLNFLAALRGLGFTVVESGGIFKVVPEADAKLQAGTVCLSAGAVMSAALLLASANDDHPRGLANGSDQVGRNFMNHNLTGMVAYNPLRRNRSVYEKTIQVNDWYLTGGPGGEPLGNIQMLGRVTGPILAGEAGLPLPLATHIADRSVHIMAMSEDLPDPESRVFWRKGQVVLDWRKTNTRAHDLLVAKLKKAMRKAGWPVGFVRGFPKWKPSHQCGTARMGADPLASVVDMNLKAHDLDNLWIADASVLPTSAAVNPSLTVAALALRLGEHLAKRVQA